MKTMVAVLLALIAQELGPRVDRLECRDSGGMWEAGECLCSTGKEFVAGEGCVVVEEPPPPPPPDEPPPPTGALADAVWRSIPGSEMRSIYDPAIDQIENSGSADDFSRIQSAWSGATCVGNELVLMGGGHGDGANNGIFAVDVLSGQWRRVTMPSPIWTEATCPAGEDGVHVCEPPVGEPCRLGRCGVGPDGRPVARHTYYQLATDGADLYILGGSIFGRGNAGEPPHFFRLDMAEGEWYVMPQPPRAPNRPHGSLLVADDALYQFSASFQGQRYDFEAATWEGGGTNPMGTTAGTGVVHAPSTDRVYALGSGVAWSASVATWPPTDHADIEAAGLAQASGPGLTYYPPEDRLLLWQGGRTVETVDPHTHEWGAVTPSGEDPGAALPAGTYGRFAYCGGRVVLVNGVDAPLYYLDLGTVEPEPEPEPEPGPVALGADPYYAEPPGDALVEATCGPRGEWPVHEIRTNSEADAFGRTSDYDGERVQARVHWKEMPYPTLRLERPRCVRVVGVPGPNGERPLLGGANATHAFDGTIREGGVWLEGVDVSPGRALALDPSIDAKTSGDCIGVRNDARFLILRDVDATQCAHHIFITAHAHHLYVELGRVNMSQAGSHLAYVDHVAMAYVYDSTFESPGWGHALRCVARRCKIERTRVSNVQLDGSVLPAGSNPINPNREYVGMHPLEVYTCGQHEVSDVEATVNGAGWAASFRWREAMQTCDTGGVVGDQWQTLRWGTPEYAAADWSALPDLTLTVRNFTVNCPTHDCAGWDVKSAYPMMDGQKGALQSWLRAGAFSSWEEMVAAIPPEHPEWAFVASVTLPGHRSAFLDGSITNKVPLPVPENWRQRARIVLDGEIQWGQPWGANFRAYQPSNTYCLGEPPVDGSCVEQTTGKSYDRAIVEEN